MPPAAAAGVLRDQSGLWPLLLLLGWLILAVMLATLIWLMLAPCGLRPWPFGRCDALAQATPDLEADRDAVLANIAALAQRQASKGQGCDLQGAAPHAPLQAVPPQSPAATPPPESLPGQKAEAGLDAAELDRRLAEHGLTPEAALNISLVWSGRDDLDLKLKCPDGVEVDFRHKSAPSRAAVLDIDANFPVANSVEDPVENISVGKASAGRCLLAMRCATDQPPQGDTHFRPFIRQQGAAPQTFDERLVAGADPWTSPLEIAAP